MVRPTGYRLGLDDKGVVHVQASFPSGGPEDLRFKWETAFALVRTKGVYAWGLWDGSRVVWATEDLSMASKILDALLVHEYFLTDTLMPESVEGWDPGSWILIAPAHYTEKVELPLEDLEILTEHLEIIERSVRDQED